MPVNLNLCISQQENIKPYRFKITGVNVYSFEEALYHCYYYWKQSVDDFMSEEFIKWVRESLELSFLASKMKGFFRFSKISQRFTAFLKLIDYFSDDEIEELRGYLILWENRNEWEKLKERGDFLISKDNPEKACYYYKKALEYGVNVGLYNNIAISYMKMERYDKAIVYLNRALELKPGDYTLLAHIAEAYILNKNFDRACSVLEDIRNKFGEKDEIYYFFGEINFYQANYSKAVVFYQKASDMASGKNTDYIYRLSDTYVKMRFYDRALNVLEQIENKDETFLKKQADVYVEYNNVPAAIKCIERALYNDKNNAELWIRLAKYYRLEYDFTRASAAVSKALDLSAQNIHANIEDAKIKKATGRMKDYQIILNKILSEFKVKYRENEYDLI